MLAKGMGVLPALATGVLVIAIGWQLARLAWVFAPYPDPAATALKPLVAAPATPAGQSIGQAAIDRLVNASLFGKAARPEPGASQTPVATDPVDAPDTTLSLELLGTIASDATEESYALIHEKGKETKVYGIGESVTRGAKLHSVFPDRVLLDRSGRLEALRLPKELDTPGSQARTSSLPRRTQSLTRPSIANVIADNATQLTDVFRPQPVFADGQQKGYRLYPGRDRRKFAALGLRPGDLVTEINGTALNDPASGMEIFKTMGESTSVTVTLERNGQPEVLVLDTASLQALDEE